MQAEIPLPVRRVFFGPFGGRLRPIQQAAWAELSNDRDGLVVAPTGMGKTEAVFVPIACRLLDGDSNAARKLRVLVISPTRALASDLHARMSSKFAELGLRLDAATSDRNTRSRTVPSDVLIRTPEGLDSDLCRHPEQLAGIHDVVIDEIHTFLADARGTQLIGLLSRLTSLASSHRRIGISATIPNLTVPEAAGLLRNPTIVSEDADMGELHVEWHSWVGKREQGVSSFLRKWRELGIRKAIGFVRTRARAEEVASILNTGFLSDKCLVHHGSTASAVRRHTEEQLRRLQIGLAVATTTLEVGIDVGDVDRCILFDVPQNPSSLIQRAGRAGRRSGLRRVLCVTGLYDTPTDFARIVAQVKSPSRAITDVRPFLAGCLQQSLSFCAAENGRTPADLVRFLEDAYAIDEILCNSLITALMEHSFLRQEADRLLLADRGVRMLKDRSIHLTFASGGGTAIVEMNSGRTLGRAKVQGRDHILLAGRSLQVTGADPRTGAALSEERLGGQASFSSNPASTFEALARSLAPRMGGRFRL